MSWFDVADGRLRFRGRVTKQPIVDWVSTDEGTEAVQAAAHQTGFSLFGRVRAARRRISRELWEAIAAPSLRDTIAAEGDRYLAAWTEVAYAPSLPRATVGLQRLVVIPRAMIVDRALPGARARLDACLKNADVADAFRVFFSRWVLCDMDAAIRRASPCPRHPVYARESWACVAVDSDFTWIDPMWSGPEWLGHVMMFEMPSGRFHRRDRRELEATIEQLKQSLPNLPRPQRDSTVRLALDQMKSLRV